MQHDLVQRRSLLERIFHAVCFEGIATAILAPTTAWLMQRSVLEMGGLTILLATTAMIWNIIYNALFDHFWPSHVVTRTAKVRALHALGFESGFIVIGVSIVAWALNVSLLQAFTLEIGFFLFFLPYTMFYNWAYDTLRLRVVRRRQQRVTA
ncbi:MULTISPECIES: multidrug/biocide efflux PACE transporter [Citrobacter]|uniref:multidrug/biocide efflux PACE transporter n=1 Tax=Citrobacter TaxID=544 RepID=UPI000CE6657A|nr:MULTISPECIES: multidrug/biocide efflux PACE transporter [Citrobacter]AVE58407.1 Na(+)-translocating NADH-quinone reductase subunit E [Citrobacter koseri]ELO4692200.1 multidrug/biocide efflux PACE transporter [Citrobacter koseri]MBJ8866508.1 multidrug/biocide efflux PACE transporter [Citrobacter koseri]MBL4563995.1 multidrug/biocide efflux PACE transporter [Citrobacter koseri]MCK7561168.1 multidrug/biocide efflux PACE transporter [Citrobacter koseri]